MAEDNTQSYTHIVAYDCSESASYCRVEHQDDYEYVENTFSGFLKESFIKELEEKYPTVKFSFIAWNSEAWATDSIEPVSKGQSDPSKIFDVIEKQFPKHEKKLIHLITTGEINNFNYEKLKILNCDDRLDIHIFGDCKYKFSFYQRVKIELQEKCNVYINKNLVQNFKKVDFYSDKDFHCDLVLSEEEILELLNYNFSQVGMKFPVLEKFLSVCYEFCCDCEGINDRLTKAFENTLAKMMWICKGNPNTKSFKF